MASANHLLMVFMAIEMASVPSYVLAGMSKGRRLGSEDLVNVRTVGSKPLAHLVEREGEAKGLEFWINRSWRHQQLLQARQKHPGAPLAVWLGILLDGIPESLVIGFGFLTLLGTRLAASGDVSFADVIPYTLVAGLFLSNFPEALSSSAAMRHQEWRTNTIFNLWFSLMVITTLGAGLGYIIGGSLPHAWLVLAEGLAAGAMLTMIASTMIPEAVHSGNPPAVGLGTLAGFLGALLFKLVFDSLRNFPLQIR